MGDAFIILKSIKGVINGVNIVDNMFSGSGKGIDIVQINGNFGNIDQVVIDQNNAQGMNLKATVARGFTQGNGTSWRVDFIRVLLFLNKIRHVQYSLSTSESFPNHALGNVSGNSVLVESNVAMPADVYVTVD
ncbi:hypothetical protein GIB67_013078 [Kingdonia uniflora]|uniref:Uncharacterized protein n=1 Tax=Kingdonia uniflora TaxID=39325 RepID=A0A7J7LXC8_9MAGN|nr:hypothetical protein GIB67_013078 [Kingdonia uniflora]